MEQVWQKLKRDQPSNRVFKDYEAIVDACCKAWNTFCDEQGAIKKICVHVLGLKFRALFSVIGITNNFQLAASMIA